MEEDFLPLSMPLRPLLPTGVADNAAVTDTVASGGDERDAPKADVEWVAPKAGAARHAPIPGADERVIPKAGAEGVDVEGDSGTGLKTGAAFLCFSLSLDSLATCE